MYPWKDYSGRTSPLKLIVVAALLGPVLWVASAYQLGWLEPRPYTAAIREVGLWTIRLIGPRRWRSPRCARSCDGRAS